MSESNNHSFKSALAVAGAGLSMAMSNPFDLIRIRMQTMGELVEMGVLQRSYAGVLDCMRRVRQEEGLWAFWKGNSANLLRFYGSETINYLSK